MKFEGIIFDLDGTLVHTIEDIGDAANEVFSRHGFQTFATADYIRWIGNGATRLMQRAVGEDLSADQIKSYVGEFREAYSNNLHNKSRLYEGIPELLDALVKRGIKLSVLSNKPHLLTRDVTDHYLSGWPFDPVFGQREDVPLKPDPCAAIEIAGLMDLDPARILFVGDSHGDLQTATASGMKPVGVSWGYGKIDGSHAFKDAGIIHHPRELLDFFSN